MYILCSQSITVSLGIGFLSVITVVLLHIEDFFHSDIIRISPDADAHIDTHLQQSDDLPKDRQNYQDA